MATEADVERLALSLPNVVAEVRHGQQRFAIEGKGVAWAYLAREKPKTPRVLVPGVVAIRCPIEEKEMLIEAAPEIYFDDDHYRGFPGVLVRLAAIGEAELKARLERARDVQAPKRRRR
ncbi:MAG TPA: MmcQ/YjbR family DNA-binding protein [Caulobacteraceae bacterium]|nr:MmcQ/YjbR family DNA-binding protein [Caulobacteraceae bacterium]